MDNYRVQQKIYPSADGVDANNAEWGNLKKAVEDFSADMFEKLWQKYKEGWTGWDEASYDTNMIKKQIDKHVKRLSKKNIQEVDIANLCMFYWFKRKLMQVK